MQDKEDYVEYEVYFEPFRIIMRIRDEDVMIINAKDTLYFENRQIK